MRENYGLSIFGSDCTSKLCGQWIGAKLTNNFSSVAGAAILMKLNSIVALNHCKSPPLVQVNLVQQKLPQCPHCLP